MQILDAHAHTPVPVMIPIVGNLDEKENLPLVGVEPLKAGFVLLPAELRSTSCIHMHTYKGAVFMTSLSLFYGIKTCLQVIEING